jgi:membrane-bound lytic murein transglycosylase A
VVFKVFSRISFYNLTLIFLINLTVCSCSSNKFKDEQIVPVSPPNNFLDNSNAKTFVAGLTSSIDFLSRRRSKKITIGSCKSSYKKLYTTLKKIEKLYQANGLTKKFFLKLKEDYIFLASKPLGTVLLTGYFQSKVQGARNRSLIYKYPLFSLPKDRSELDLTRAEIDARGKLNGKGYELVWLKDPVERAFLHVQGSGIVTLPNGEDLRVHYAGRNNHPYRAIGNYLLHNKVLRREDISMQSIKFFLKEHPNLINEVLNYNPSYIFFKISAEEPIGSTGIKLIPLRSIATDSSLFPQAAIGYVTGLLPQFDKTGKITGYKKFGNLVFNHDTGSAIKGVKHIDLYMGTGKEAGELAGEMKHLSALFLIFHKNDIKCS